MTTPAGATETKLPRAGTFHRIALALTGLTAAFAAFSAGGVTTREWNICLVVLCVLSLAVCARARSSNPVIDIVLIALPVYVALQLAPLPFTWLRALSPARAELARALLPLGTDAPRTPLSASPALTEVHLLRLLGYLCVFFLIRELRRRFARRVWMVAVPVVAIGAAEAALGLVQYFGGVQRARGTYVNANHFSCLLQMALPLPLVLAVALLRRRHNAKHVSTWKVLLACALLAIAVLIFLGSLDSLSRMGLVATAASLAVLALLLPLAVRRGRSLVRFFGYGSAAALIVVVALVIFFSTPSTLLERLGQHDATEALNSDARMTIWRETIPMIHDYPVFGSGLGTYASVFQKYRASSPEYLVDFAHNDYLQLLAELGVVGFAIAALGGVLILLRIGRAIVGRRTTADRLLAAGCLAGLIALMFDCAVDFDFYIPANALIAAWIAAMGAG